MTGSTAGPVEGSRAGAGRGWRRVVGVNAAVLAGLLLLVGGIAEIRLRSTRPFLHSVYPARFVPEAGLLLPPDREVRWTNGRDYWTVSRTNRWGFLDREPPSPERAAAGCHLTVIGDSFVEAKEVAVEYKFPAILEGLGARAFPALDLTVSAFGRGGTAQVHQLPFYDRYARRLSPKLVILVFHRNDFPDNHAMLYALREGFDPERLPFATAVRGGDGRIRLRPPHPDAAAGQWAAGLGVPESASRLLRALALRLREVSYAADWVYGRARTLYLARLGRHRSDRLEEIGAAAGPPPFGDWRPGRGEALYDSVTREIGRAFAADGGEGGWEARLPPAYREAVAMTGFALDEFRSRADRDGARLWLLATHRTTEVAGREAVAALRSLAEARGIPVLDQYQAIVRAGGDPREASLSPRDHHWSRAGHRWAAEAVLARLEAEPEVCGGAGGFGGGGGRPPNRPPTGPQPAPPTGAKRK